jgi:hypothetical protein
VDIMETGLDSSVSECGSVSGCCERGNGSSCSINCEELFNYLYDYSNCPVELVAYYCFKIL